MFSTLMDAIKDAILSNMFRSATNLLAFQQLMRMLPRQAVHQEVTQFDGGTAAGPAAVATAGTGSSAAGDISLGENGLPAGVTIRRDVAKVGRNDPCPCGSGKKFKQCCGK